MKIRFSGTSLLVKLGKKEEKIDWTEILLEIDGITLLYSIEIIASAQLTFDSLPMEIENVTINTPKINQDIDLSQHNLKKLKLINSDLTHLPKCRLERLVTLYLQRNKIESISEDELSQLGHVEDLDLGQNKLTSLPDCFDKLKSLKRLNLENNQLTELPESFYQLPNIGHLAIRGNPLSDETKQRIFQTFRIIID